ncbi:MAG: hypothetical protein L3K26_12220, partial [Candidatus Hydrogenedentes bacterium]|nr:hypothetical protein [Candidatus Hydrogenedentota bacterium]
YLEPPFAHYEYEETYTGSASTSSASYTIAEYAWSSIIHNSDAYIHVRDDKRQSNSSFTVAGSTYQFVEALAIWHSGSVLNDPGLFSVVIEPENWRVSGSLIKDGQLFGSVQYDKPLVADSHGPELVLHTTSGEEVFLHTLIVFP